MMPKEEELRLQTSENFSTASLYLASRKARTPALKAVMAVMEGNKDWKRYQDSLPVTGGDYAS